MRDSRAVATHISGPEWTEPELAENGIPESPDALAFHHEEELPADLALDLRLHEILEHAVRATAATGAVIALSSGDKMVCRATSGKKAPSTGAFLNTRSGLSGLCVQTGEMQRCDDTLTDPRVNADACRNLDIQSIVVLPVLEGTKLWGILEIFSSLPHAFSDADIQAADEQYKKDQEAAAKPAPRQRAFVPSPVESLAAPAAPQILSRSTVSAVESAFNSLAHTVLSNNARTLEDLVKEMLRPMLKSWLDDNLPGLVERIVKTEIERVSRGER